MVTRQTLARYAFFEDARSSTNHSEDALIPLILPTIAGREGKIFSSDELGRDLTEIFGPDLALNLASSLGDALLRQGYLKREILAEEGAICVYTQKLAEIPLETSISRAEQDLEEILSALDDYGSVTPMLSPLRGTRREIGDHLVNWMTTVEASEIADRQTPSNQGPNRTPGPTGEAPGAPERDEGIPDRLRMFFSSFVAWLSREREATFEKVLTFVELGLVIDLVSEIRVPTRRKNNVNLTVVLDSRLIMELVGLYGPQSEAAIRRLLDLCKTYGVHVITMVHLVDEMNEVIHNTLLYPNSCSAGSIAEAMQKHPEIASRLKVVYKAPDRAVREAGIEIYQYTQTTNVNSERLFTTNNIVEFQNLLPYDEDKINMRRRDAWTLAFAVRRQNGVHTSNVYEARCMILTRSFPFVATARRYLKSDAVGYPGYAVAPIMELRHFSTLFMLSFGTGATKPIVRAELVASCDRIVRVSPTLTRRIRAVLGKMQDLPEDQLEAALSDPSTMSELALATGNDLALVTDQNGAALLAVIKNAATKEAELRHLATEAEREARHRDEIVAREQIISSDRQELSALQISLKHQADEFALMRRDAERKDDLFIYAAVRAIHREVSVYWLAVLVMAALVGMGFLADYLFHITGMATPLQMLAGTALGGLACYMTLATFLPRVAPQAMRRQITRLIARRQLKSSMRPDLSERVLAYLERDHALQTPSISLPPDPMLKETRR